MTRRPAQISLALLAVGWVVTRVCAQDAPAPSPAATAVAPPAASPVATPEPSLAERLELKLNAYSDLLAEAEKTATPEGAAAAGVTLEDLQARVGRRRELQSLVQRQITTLRRREEAQKSLDDLARRTEEFKARKPDEPQRNKIAILDALKDQLEAEKGEDATLALGLETHAKALADAEARLQRADQARREARERLSQNTDAAQKPRLEFDAAEADLQRRIADESLQFARLQLETGEMEQKLGAAHTAFLELQIASAEPATIFTRDELEEKKLDITRRRDKFERELRDLQRTHQANERLRTEAREALDRARGEAEVAKSSALLDMRDAWAVASARAIELHEARIADLGTEQRLWEMRHLAHSGADDLQLQTFETSAREIADEVRRTRTLYEARLSDVRAMALEIEKRLENWEEALGDKATAESKLKALRRREENTKAYLDSLLAIDRLTRRLLEEITAFRANPTWEDRWIQLRTRLSQFWQRELFVLDDRSFTLLAITTASVTLAAVLLLLFGLRWLVVRRLRRSAPKTATKVDDILLMMIEGTGPLFLVALALWIAVKPLPLSGASSAVIGGVLTLLLLAQVAVWGNALLAAWVESTMRRRRGEDPASVSALGAVAFFGRALIWLLVVLVAFYSFGVQVGPLVAGLGVTGIAIAFALQNILGDVLCSVAILLDKPFVVGDFIVTGDTRGTVEHIGIKTTRVRNIEGQLTILPNAALMGSKIDNYKRMYERRVLFRLGVVYGTPAEKLEQIPKKLREIVESRPLTRFDRAHLARYGEYSLDFEVVYYVLSADFNRFADTHQAVLLDIYRWLGGQGIDFAFPTQTVHYPGGINPEAAFEFKSRDSRAT